MNDLNNLKNELANVGRYLLAHELAWGTSGNMSARLDEDNMVITASGTFMGDLGQDDFVITHIPTGTYEGTRRASKETPFHTGIYNRRPDVGAILHSSPFYSTMVACSETSIFSELFIETMYYLENIAYVNYYHPGTEELGKAIAEKSEEANVIIMKNHGVVVFDDYLTEAKMRLETMEMACRMIITAKSSGIMLNRIPDKVVTSFLEDSKYKPRKILGGQKK
ncbi:class II aldolase/adducin family protein [Paenibacillus illinoisensis]|uniref:class II aldolase/adducin family protein n=1 Tax=Paenibacillus illinoisensis TaxID=59845 RepID=UPI003D2E06AE